MKSHEAGFRKVAPGIDRLFRFVEMIGVTALLAIILPSAAPLIKILGTEMALYYLFEPAIDAFSFWIVPEVNGRQDVVRISVIGFIAIFGILMSSFVVSGLVDRVSHTISLAGS